MSDSTTKSKDEKETLPVGHPQAGYTSPDLSTHEGRGKAPKVEQEWHDERNKAQQKEAEAVADAEDKAAKAEAKEREKELEKQHKEQDKLAKA